MQKGPKLDEGGLVISCAEGSLGWVVTFAKGPGGDQQRPTRNRGANLYIFLSEINRKEGTHLSATVYMP